MRRTTSPQSKTGPRSHWRFSRYLLDTNILSDILKHPQGKAAQKIQLLSSKKPDLLATSIIVAAELRYGAAKSDSPTFLIVWINSSKR